MKSIRDKSIFEKFKEQKKLDELKKKQDALNSKVAINQHIDQKNFHSNFHGIKDIFIKLFGT